MRNRQSLLNWGIILVLLLGAGILTIAWPAISGSLVGNSATRPIPAGPETIVITLPVPIAGVSELTFQSWQLMGIVAFLVIGAVITGGIVLAIINWLLSRIITNTKETPEYQQEAAELERNVTADIKTMQGERPTHSIPDSTWSRWAVATTSLVILMFVVFFGLLIGSTLFPDGTVVWRDRLVNITALFTLALVAITLIVLFFAVRSRRKSETVDSRSTGIPWDTIVVAVTGLLVVGIGVGVILLLNSPS
ncbi:MAG: hypothetical protein R3C44_06640 [Chloroflexota bacterium]